MKRALGFLIIIIFIFPALAAAEEMRPFGPLALSCCERERGGVGEGFDKGAYIASMEKTKILRIAMVDCVAMALKNNSEILIRSIAPKIEDANVKTASGKFDPSFSFDFEMEDNTDNSDRPLFGPNPTKVRTSVINFGYDQALISGTKIALDFNTTRTRSNYDPFFQAINPTFDSFAAVTVTQPLMRGGGIVVTQADFLIAKNNKLKSIQEFKKDVMKTLTDVKKAYYDFQYSRAQYQTAVVSLKRVEDLYNINKEKYAKGIASNVDLLQSEAEVARFEKAVAGAEGVMKLAEDNLKFITNLVNDVELWSANIEPLDALAYEKKELDSIDSLDKAFSHRPDYEAAKIDLKNKDITVIYNKNGMLPIVDLVGSWGYNGLAKNFEKDMGILGSGMYNDWKVGVSVTVPLGNDDAKGKYQKSKLEKQQAMLAFKRMEQKIILEVRSAVREVDIRYRMLEASIKNRDAEQKNYEAQEARFRAGLVSTHDIIDYQEKLARAEVSYAEA
ncbi:MAG: TolC family protein, partial [Candidatus Omnitrophica bacterium]|nr:TolC family protein [Candidatus Omnitrophota bacterium]